MYLFLLFTLGIFIVFAYYMFLPYRNIKNYEAYRIAMEGFETQSNSLMQFYLGRHKQFDMTTSLDTTITEKEYKARIKDCYNYVMKNVSQYRYKEVLLYCTKDEIETMLLLKIETLIFEEYGDRIIQDVDLLQDRESLIDITTNINKDISTQVDNILYGGDTN